MSALELRRDQAEAYSLLSILRNRNPVRKTGAYPPQGGLQRRLPTTGEGGADQVYHKIAKAPHRTSAPPVLATPEVREAMLATLPGLRAFAISLTGNRDAADDLVQEAVLRALSNLDKFELGSSMSAWLFTILRNAFYSQCRKTQREVHDPDGVHAGRLRMPPNQGYACEYQELLQALAQLSPGLREALILVGAQGMTYDEAAHIAGVPLGTIKSRVARARARLAQLMSMDKADDLRPDRMTLAALQSVS